jgi:hypothetical protein
MEIVEEAAFFVARGADQGGEFGLQEEFLAGLGVHDDYEGHSIFGEFDGFEGTTRSALDGSSRFFRFAFGHGAGLYSSCARIRKLKLQFR